MATIDLSYFPPTERVEWLWFRLSITEAVFEQASGFVWEPGAPDEDRSPFALHIRSNRAVTSVTHSLLLNNRGAEVGALWRSPEPLRRLQDEDVMTFPSASSALKATICDLFQLRSDTSVGKECGSCVVLAAGAEGAVSVDVVPTMRGERLVFIFSEDFYRAVRDIDYSAMSSMLPIVEGAAFSRTVSLTHDGIVRYASRARGGLRLTRLSAGLRKKLSSNRLK